MKVYPAYSSQITGNDCVVRALANAAGMTYAEALDICAEHGRKPNCGMYQSDWLPMFEKHVELTKTGLHHVCPTAITLTRELEKRRGMFLVKFSRHLAVYHMGWLDWISGERRHRVRKVWIVEGVC